MVRINDRAIRHALESAIRDGQITKPEADKMIEGAEDWWHAW